MSTTPTPSDPSRWQGTLDALYQGRVEEQELRKNLADVDAELADGPRIKAEAEALQARYEDATRALAESEARTASLRARAAEVARKLAERG